MAVHAVGDPALRPSFPHTGGMKPSVGLHLATVPVLALGLAGCMLGPDFQRPKPPATASYLGPDEATRPASGAPRPVARAEPPLRWWTAFGSRRLDALVDRAMADNQSLAGSNATLAQARAQVQAAAGALFPQVSGNARVEREQVNLSAYGFNSSAFPGISNPTFGLYTVGGGVSYDADLFGANRRRLEQARAQADAQFRQTEAARLTIAGRVVSEALTIAAIRARIDTSNALLAQDRRLVDLTEARRRAGEGTLVEVLNARSQLADDRGDIPQLTQQLDEARHALATLVGVPPSELGPADFTLAQFALPRRVPVVVPSRLVRKRPDILQAEADLHADTAAIGVATAALYPDLSIGGTFSTAAPAAASLFTGSYRGFDLFAGLTAPIFEGGTLRAQQRGAVEAAHASAATYRETVLEAFQQVADLLDALQNDQRSVMEQSDAAQTALRNRDLSERSFQAGNTGILSVLDATRLYQRARLALVEAEARQYLDIARLYVATAGGWTGPEPEMARAG